MKAPTSSLVPRRVTFGALAAAGLGVSARPAGAQSAGTSGAGHVVLLGDSIFDNKAYVAGGPDVLALLRGRLRGGWRATLAAIDGAVTGDVRGQLAQVPVDVTHLIVSVGGNDALQQEGVLGEGARSVGEALARLADLRERFWEDYRAMLRAVLAACRS